jgi:hypothetical protein
MEDTLSFFVVLRRGRCFVEIERMISLPLPFAGIGALARSAAILISS